MNTWFIGGIYYGAGDKLLPITQANILSSTAQRVLLAPGIQENQLLSGKALSTSSKSQYNKNYSPAMPYNSSKHCTNTHDLSLPTMRHLLAGFVCPPRWWERSLRSISLYWRLVGYEYGNEMWPYTSWISLVYLQVFRVYPLSKYLFDIHRRVFLAYIYFWIIFMTHVEYM